MRGEGSSFKMHVRFQVSRLFQPPGLGDVNKANCNPIFSTQIPTKVNENSLGIQKSGFSILTPKITQHTNWDVSVTLKYSFPPKRVLLPAGKLRYQLSHSHKP